MSLLFTQVQPHQYIQNCMVGKRLFEKGGGDNAKMNEGIVIVYVSK